MGVSIYDSNNYVRVKSETSLSGSFIRTLIEEANNGNDLKFYVFDGKNSNAWRRQFYPKYKMTRKAPIDNFYENLSWFKHLLSFCKPNVCVAELAGFEGDDVIAEIASWFKHSAIYSTDKDLTRIEGADFPMGNTKWESKKFIFTRKVLCGDPSDNISGVKGFGETTWKSLSEIQKEWAREWVELGASDAKTYFADSLPQRSKNVILGVKNEDLDVLKKVVGFRPVDKKDLKLDWGTDDPARIEEELSEYGL